MISLSLLPSFVRSTLSLDHAIRPAQQFNAGYSQQLTRLMQREEDVLAQVYSNHGRDVETIARLICLARTGQKTKGMFGSAGGSGLPVADSEGGAVARHIYAHATFR